MDDEKSPATPVGAQKMPIIPDAPKLSPRAHAKKVDEGRLVALADAEEDRKKFHADIKEHISLSNSEQNDSAEPHPMVHEHAELRGFKQVKVIDPQSMQPVDRPCWQMQALVAHFHAHGLRHDARISHEMFEKALREVLHGRV